jgi:hypothetical protein
MENQEAVEKNDKARSHFTEKVNKVDNCLPRLKEGEKDSPVSRVKKGLSQPLDIRGIIKGCCG